MAMRPTINGRMIEPDKYAFVLKSTRARIPCEV